MDYLLIIYLESLKVIYNNISINKSNFILDMYCPHGQPRWDPCGARLHFRYGTHMGSPYGAHMGAHMGPTWVPYKLFAGLLHRALQIFIRD